MSHSVYARAIDTLRRFLVEDDGPTATEYAFMLGLIVLTAVGAISALGTKMVNVFQYDYECISNAVEP